MTTAVFLTDTDKIRAVLGTTEYELEDAQIIDLGVADSLQINLTRLYPDYVTLKAAIDGNTATDEQKLIWLNIGLYLRYQGAVEMLDNIQMWANQKFTDGDIDNERFNKDNLQETIDRITGKRDIYATAIDVNSSLIPVTLFLPVAVAERDYDPVTNT